MQSCFLSFACTPRRRVRAHHAVVCMHTTSCVCTPPCYVHAHHVMCMHTMLCVCTPCRCVRAHHAVMCMHTTLCTPHRGVHFSQISLQSHVTPHLSQSEGSILSNLSDLVRNCEISPKIFPPFKEQSCYNSSAKNGKIEIRKTQSKVVHSHCQTYVTPVDLAFFQSTIGLVTSERVT